MMTSRYLHSRAFRCTARCALVLATLLGSACTAHSIFDLNPGSCINPPNGHCAEDGQDSRWLDVRAYQLKKSVDPCALDLDEFKKGSEIPAAIKGALTDKDRLDAVVLQFAVQRSDPKRLRDWSLLKDTRAVLIVALGRGRGKNSVRLLPVWQLATKTALYFSEYDVCIGESCERRPQEQCP